MRTIEAARARIEHSDGTIEEYSGTTAEEWPWTPDGRASEWRLFGIPILQFFERGVRLDGMTISLLAENGEIILRIGSIAIGIQASAHGRGPLMGSETPVGQLR